MSIKLTIKLFNQLFNDNDHEFYLDNVRFLHFGYRIYVYPKCIAPEYYHIDLRGTVYADIHKRNIDLYKLIGKIIIVGIRSIPDSLTRKREYLTVIK